MARTEPKFKNWTDAERKQWESDTSKFQNLAKNLIADMKIAKGLTDATALNMGHIVDLTKEAGLQQKKDTKFRTESNDLTKEVLQNVKNIGTEEFRSFNITVKLARARREGKTNLVEQLEITKGISGEQERQHKLLNEQANLLGQPFQALDSMIKQIPIIGDLLSASLGLDDMAADMMNTYKATAAQKLMGTQEIDVTTNVEDVDIPDKSMNVATTVEDTTANVTPIVEDIGELSADAAISNQSADAVASSLKDNLQQGTVEGVTSGLVEAHTPFQKFANKFFKKSMAESTAAGAKEGILDAAGNDITDQLKLASEGFAISAKGEKYEIHPDAQKDARNRLGLSKETVNVEKELTEESKNTQKATGGILSNLKWGRIAIGTGLALMVKLAYNTYRVTSELGLSLDNMLSLAGAINPDAVIAFAKEFGTVNNLTAKSALNLRLMSFRFNVSAESAAKLTKAMSNISSQSTQQIIGDMYTFNEQLQKAGVVSPAQVMEDVANNTELFAKFGKDGGKNILNAAAAAAKLGISIGSVASAAESLLDFETSIEKQLEAEILLGRGLNLEKARQLSFAGKFEDLQVELVRLVGSETEWNNLNFIQRRALAEALGSDLTTISNIVGAQQKQHEAAGLVESTARDIGAAFMAMAPVIMGIVGGLVAAPGAIRTALTRGLSMKGDIVAAAKGMAMLGTGIGAGAAAGFAIQNAYEVEDAKVEDGQLVSYGEGQMLNALPNDDVAIAPNLFDTMAENKQVTQQIVNAELNTSEIESLLGQILTEDKNILAENKKYITENQTLRTQQDFLFRSLGNKIGDLVYERG